MIDRKKFLLCLLFCVSVLTAGCAFIPTPGGGEPFGEKTCSQKEGEEVFSDFRHWFEKKDLSGWRHYVGFSGDTGYELEVEYWHSETYTAASASVSPYKEYLWYQDTLFLGERELVTAANVSWEDMECEALLEQAEDYLRLLLERAPEKITYKYIPMAGDEPYMLKLEYPYSEFDMFDREVKSEVVVYFDEGGNPGSIAMSCNTQALVKDGLFVRDADSFFASWNVEKEETDFYQAERKLWTFGHTYGLTEEENVVPALSYQEENREACRAVIESMDFSSLAEKAEKDDELKLPSFQEFCKTVRERDE